VRVRVCVRMDLDLEWEWLWVDVRVVMRELYIYIYIYKQLFDWLNIENTDGVLPPSLPPVSSTALSSLQSIFLRVCCRAVPCAMPDDSY